MGGSGWRECVVAGINPGSYSGGIETDLSQPLPPQTENQELAEVRKQLADMQPKIREAKNQQYSA